MLRRHAQSAKRCTGDAGSSLVEMAFMVTPLCLLLFGIVVYGYLMSFRQNMTQAAAEGARAGAVAPPDSNPTTHVYATNQAMDATNKALGSFGQACGNGRSTCSVSIGTCPAPSTATCVTVTVTYDYANHPLMPSVPIVTNFIPSTFTSSFTAQVNQ